MARRKNKKKLRKSIAIVCEGSTEFFYFNDYRCTEGKSLEILPKLPKHTDIQSIANTARKLIGDGYDHVYCVFDLDVIYNNEKNHKYYDMLIKENSKNKKITFFESMPCFEFWLFLHFKYSTKQHESCSTCVDDLKKYIGDYSKNQEYQQNQKFYSKMKGNKRLKAARDNSKRVYAERNNEKKNKHHSFSKMHLLLEELDKFD